MDIQLWRKRQKELRLTYKQISEKAGVSKRTVEDIFRGFTTSPRIDTVQAIETALGLAENKNNGRVPDGALPFINEFEPLLTDKDYIKLSRLFKAANGSIRNDITFFLEGMMFKAGYDTKKILNE